MPRMTHEGPERKWASLVKRLKLS